MPRREDERAPTEVALPPLPGGADAFEVLSSPPRRRALTALRDEPATLDDLVEAIPSGDGTRVAADGERDLRVSLYHVHLPKLVDAGVVARDPGTGEYRLTEDGRALADAFSE